MIETTGPPEKKPPVRKDWTKGSIVKNILMLSWPVMVLSGLYTGNLVLEMIWVGRLGPASIAAVGISGFIVLLVVTTKSGLGAGERAMVARFIGAGDQAGANHVAGQAFVISAVYGAIVTLVGVLFTVPIVGIFGLESDVAAESVSYLRIVLSGWLTESFWITSFSVMQASGDSITPMKVAIFIRVVNAVICPFMVLGWWIFPRLGVSGAAISYIIITGLGMLICQWVFFTGKTRLKLSLRDFYPDPGTIRRMLKIGLPASVMGLGKTFGDLVLTTFMVPFGTMALAAHNLLSRIESFINTPGMGLGTGSGVLVGQNLGAGQPDRAAKSGWLAAGMVAGFMVVCSVILVVLAENIISLFNVEPELVKTGAGFLRVAVAGYIGIGTVMVLQNCISGSGDTIPAMLISLAMLWIVQIPLALLLTRFTNLGAFGVRWAIVISFITGAIAYLVYFRQGRWKRKKV
ncbi:MAG: MATE family efflux transporter [Dehalococcoidales bacterium]|nr:MATE family efflux transporter [Dehalococcoidales bacterium]